MGHILQMVIDWADHHKDDPPQDEEDENKEKKIDDIPPWDLDFLKVDQGTLFELILAANYLDIKGLLDLTCKTVANMIKGKTPEEIRKTFNIKNDFTPSEEEQVDVDMVDVDMMDVDMVDMDTVDMDMVDMDMVDMDMVDMGMVDMDTVDVDMVDVDMVDVDM